MISGIQFSGMSDDNKPSSKVLRPPGGGSSDIFGADMPQTPRSVKNHMQSNIFSSDKNESNKNYGDHRRGGPGNVDSSYTRLFGGAERPVTPSKNHMKSNISFGANNEVAHKLLSNGNGYIPNNKSSGSVSSASSSVSSSTENLKINGLSKIGADPACPVPPEPISSALSNNTKQPELVNIDLPCEEKISENTADISKLANRNDVGNYVKSTQTRCDAGINTQSTNPISLSQLSPEYSNKGGQLDECPNLCSSKELRSRNPITGFGMGDDGIGRMKQKNQNCPRDGNPVTGEGYKSGMASNNSSVNLNNGNQVINKNRIPPGGFSSGLW